MKNLPVFTIIIPVYNGLSHDLPICLASIFDKQRLERQKYEVICVDDCSKDDTFAWLQAKQETYENLIVIKNESNIRQGGARNNGVKAARGKYILFIDQDDYYHQGSLDKIYQFINSNDLDILVTDSAFHFKNFENNKLQLNFKYTEMMSGEEFLKNNGFIFAPWRLVIKRDYYLKHGFSFEEKVRIEDVDWACRLIRYAEKIQYQPILSVHYIQAENSTTDNIYRDKQTLIDQIIAGIRVIRVADECYSDSNLKQSVIGVADDYVFYSCKYMFGLFCTVKEKVDIISLFPDIKSRHKLVCFAKTMPVVYAMISNISVPMFRLMRKIYRWWKKTHGCL